MSYSVNTHNNLNGNFKKIQLPQWENLIKPDDHGLKDHPFESREKIGLVFSQMVYVTQPNGVTFAGTDTPAELNPPVAALSKELQWDSFQIAMRERVSYAAADRMASKEQSYLSLLGDLPKLLRLSHVDFAETLFWYGAYANGIGVVDTGGISGNVLTISVDTWAPRVWVGREGVWLDAYRSGVFVKSVQVTTYALTAHTLTVDNATGLAAGDVLHFKGSVGIVKKGVVAICTETTDQFGQNPTTYSLLKSIEVDCQTKRIRFLKLMLGIAEGRAKGLSGNVKLYGSEFTWPDIVDEVDAARADPQRAKREGLGGATIERGADNLKLITPTGTVEYQCTSFMMRSLIVGEVQDSMLKRYGGSDIHFVSEQPQGGDGESAYWLHAPNHLAYEMRTHCDNAAYTPRAGTLVLFKNIRNSVDGGL